MFDPFGKPIKGLIHLSYVSQPDYPAWWRLSCHWHPGKVRSRVGSAEEALVEIQGTERPTALANSARSAMVRFPEAG